MGFKWQVVCSFDRRLRQGGYNSIKFNTLVCIKMGPEAIASFALRLTPHWCIHCIQWLFDMDPIYLQQIQV